MWTRGDGLVNTRNWCIDENIWTKTHKVRNWAQIRAPKKDEVGSSE
jgi:hypothetical protein